MTDELANLDDHPGVPDVVFGSNDRTVARQRLAELREQDPGRELALVVVFRNHPWALHVRDRFVIVAAEDAAGLMSGA